MRTRSRFGDRPASVDLVTQFASASPARRRQLLVDAINAHSAVVERARMGQGTDRHLFALQSVARRDGIPMPVLFANPSYAKVSGVVEPPGRSPTRLLTWAPCPPEIRARSQYMSNLLSTSTVPLPFARLAGFGAVHGDGYGVGYMVQDDYTQACITSFKSSRQNRGAGAFAAALSGAFTDVVTLLQSK